MIRRKLVKHSWTTETRIEHGQYWSTQNKWDDLVEAEVFARAFYEVALEMGDRGEANDYAFDLFMIQRAEGWPTA
jgi:hypothetical protein